MSEEEFLTKLKCPACGLNVYGNEFENEHFTKVDFDWGYNIFYDEMSTHRVYMCNFTNLFITWDRDGHYHEVFLMRDIPIKNLVNKLNKSNSDIYSFVRKCSFVRKIKELLLNGKYEKDKIREIVKDYYTNDIYFDKICLNKENKNKGLKCLIGTHNYKDVDFSNVLLKCIECNKIIINYKRIIPNFKFKDRYMKL